MAEFRVALTLRIDGRSRVSDEIVVEMGDAIDAALSRIPPLYVERGRNIEIVIGPAHLFERVPDTRDTLDLAEVDVKRET